jgi:hypothetical protein
LGGRGLRTQGFADYRHQFLSTKALLKSRFRLADTQLEALPREVAADGGRFLWDLNALVV